MRLPAALVVVVTSACGFRIGAGSDPGPADAPPGDVTPDVVDGEVEIDANPVLCGNATVDVDEECDDANTATGDGCDSCRIEPAWSCASGTCKRVLSVAFTSREALASAGSSGGGTVFTHACAAGAAIIGVDGQASNGQTDIGQMRAGCSTISFDPDGIAVTATPQTTPYVGQQTAGALGIKRCANDSVVVGYIANAGMYLSGLQLICMQVKFVHGALAFGPPVTLTMWGPATRTLLAPTQCAAGEATTVFEGKSGSVFDHFDLKCAELTPVTE